MGERLMCTSSGERKMLTTVGESAAAFAGPIRVTFPSAGDTTTSGSVGGTRFGSRKKNAMKSATRNRNAATYQNPKTAAAAASSTGTTIYGMLSLTNLTCFFSRKKAQ